MQILKLPKEQFLSGNKDGIGATSSVLQKISSESRKALQFDENIIMSTMHLREHILKDADNLFNLLPNSNIGGYIQVVQAIPFGIICFTEAGIRLYQRKTFAL